MTSFTPVYNLKPTTITKAFILNALVTTIITVFTITIKKIIETHHLTKNYSESYPANKRVFQIKK